MNAEVLKQMEMTADEIKRNYRQAKDPEKQIGILADLNNCSVDEIKDILGINKPLKRLEEQQREKESIEVWLQTMMDEADRQIRAWEEKYKSYACALKVIAEYREKRDGQTNNIV